MQLPLWAGIWQVLGCVAASCLSISCECAQSFLPGVQARSPCPYTFLSARQAARQAVVALHDRIWLKGGHTRESGLLRDGASLIKVDEPCVLVPVPAARLLHAGPLHAGQLQVPLSLLPDLHLLLAATEEMAGAGRPQAPQGAQVSTSAA